MSPWMTSGEDDGLLIDHLRNHLDVEASDTTGEELKALFDV